MKLFNNLILSLVVFILATSTVFALETDVVVYKSPYCGCCKNWISHLEENGFNVVQHSVEDMSKIKAKFGISENFASCHTAVIGNYLIEGHVPASDIKKLLKDKPNIRGLSAPGMPAGQNVPGMTTRPGNASYDVLVINDTKREVFSHHE